MLWDFSTNEAHIQKSKPLWNEKRCHFEFIFTTYHAYYNWNEMINQQNLNDRQPGEKPFFFCNSCRARTVIETSVVG